MSTAANVRVRDDGGAANQLVETRLDELLGRFPDPPRDPHDFLATQFDLGLAWVHHAEGEGGLGVASNLQRDVSARLRAGGLPFDSFRLAAATVATHGTAEQRSRHLRAMFTREEIWCQLFSEPGSGSDLASLSTRAVRDGDEWIVNGQKVWTTYGHEARWGLLVARTDPDQPKHRGLTYFIADMHDPGVDVRPLRQITGDAEFNEVYFTDARIPDQNRIGDVGEGWRVALTTLLTERTYIAEAATPPRGSGPIARVLDRWAACIDRSPVMRDRVAKTFIEAEVQRLTAMRVAQLGASGTKGPETSIGKLAAAELKQRIHELCCDLEGSAGQLHDDYALLGVSEEDSCAARGMLHARAATIAGGTSEIMRNIIGERVLGLPAEPQVDRDVPWSKLPKN